MLTTQIPAPKVALVSTKKVQKTLSEAVAGLFENQSILCQLHTTDSGSVVVMTANGICATLHVQEVANAIQEGVAV